VGDPCLNDAWEAAGGIDLNGDVKSMRNTIFSSASSVRELARSCSDHAELNLGNGDAGW
jgi:hypothetical protein